MSRSFRPQICLVVLLLTLLEFNVFPANSADPTFQLTPATLVEVRDGIPNFLAKARAGQEATVVYLGGSITNMPGWRDKSFAWLQKEFAAAKLTHVNAAIGGTGSDLGAFRLEHDVLRHQPDLLFVEFAVNDGLTKPETIWRAMEGIVRQTWAANEATDIVFVYTFRVGYEQELSQGKNPRAASAHEMLAAHYGIPSINTALRIQELYQAQKLVIESKEENPRLPNGAVLFSKDGVHPLDAGHEIYRDVLADAFALFHARPNPATHGAKLRTAFVADHWQAAKLLPLNATMVSSGWKQLEPDHSLVKNFSKRVDSLWQTDTPGEALRVKFNGTTLKLYDLLGPDGGQVLVTIDGKQRGPIARFDKFCTYHRLATLTVAEGLPPGEHVAEIKLDAGQPDRRSVTDIESKKPDFDPKKYDGRFFRVGGLLLLGESATGF